MVASSMLYEALLVQPGETEAALVSHSLPGDSFKVQLSVDPGDAQHVYPDTKEISQDWPAGSHVI